jgi:hypothetical protein
VELNETHILMLLAMFAEQSGENVSETRLEFLARKLIPLGIPEVCRALEKMLESARRFPTVDEVKRALGKADLSAESEGRLLAETVANAIGKYGSLQPGNVKGALAIEQAIGPSAWGVVLRAGGWNAVVDRMGENPAAFRAQMRDMATALLESGAVPRGAVPAKLPPHSAALQAVQNHPQLEEARRGEITKQLAELKTKRTLLLMQREHDERRARDEDDEPF